LERKHEPDQENENAGKDEGEDKDSHAVDEARGNWHLLTPFLYFLEPLTQAFEASLYAARSIFGRFFNPSRFGGFPKKGF
jgi:hypothetical protein